MAIDYAVLKTECTTDPTNIGVDDAFSAGADGRVAEILNQVRGTIAIRRNDVTPLEVLESIDLRDFIANPPGVNNMPMAQSWLESLTQFAAVRLFNNDGTDSLVKDNLDRLLANTQGSQNRLNTVGVRNGSRAEQLFGQGTTISPNDVVIARQQP